MPSIGHAAHGGRRTHPQKRVAGDAIGHKELDARRLCGFSDGGICSNFPLHLFDSALPRWPTFGLNLRETRADREYKSLKDHVWMPGSNRGGIRARVEALEWHFLRYCQFRYLDCRRRAQLMDTCKTMVPATSIRLLISI